MHSGDLTHDEIVEAAAGVLPEIHAAGITALHDMSGSRSRDALRALDEADRLGLDVFATVSPDDVTDPRLRAPGRRVNVPVARKYQ